MFKEWARHGASDLSLWEVQLRGLCEFQASLGYSGRHCFKNKHTTTLELTNVTLLAVVLEGGVKGVWSIYSESILFLFIDRLFAQTVYCLLCHRCVRCNRQTEGSNWKPLGYFHPCLYRLLLLTVLLLKVIHMRWILWRFQSFWQWDKVHWSHSGTKTYSMQRLSQWLPAGNGKRLIRQPQTSPGLQGGKEPVRSMRAKYKPHVMLGSWVLVPSSRLWLLWNLLLPVPWMWAVSSPARCPQASLCYPESHLILWLPGFSCLAPLQVT